MQPVAGGLQWMLATPPHRLGAALVKEITMALQPIRSPEDLAEWMRRMNLSLTAAAEHLGRKRATISRYVNGITALPESVAHHAAVIEAARQGVPFLSRGAQRCSSTH
jgi:hypothetical protein